MQRGRRSGFARKWTQFSESNIPSDALIMYNGKKSLYMSGKVEPVMYFSNGFVYGGEPEAEIRISAVKILPDQMMLLSFTNGETRLFDASILKGPVFEPLSIHRK